MNISSMARCGFAAALISVTAWIALPFAVPFTLQTFGIFCALLILGGKLGTISIAVYIFLGVIGLPVFAGFQGGTGIILSPVGGFIIGFLATGLLYYAITDRFGEKPLIKLTALTVGLLACYASGTVWYVLFNKGIGFQEAFTVCVLPFIIPDGIKLWLAYIVSRRIKYANIFTDKNNLKAR